jgi:hypothetical protein
MGSLQTQVAGLLGKPTHVSLALWAELMRTRKASDGIVSKIQHLTGSRIHIEREKHELCIYGSNEQFSMAISLLDHLENDCIEEHLKLDTSQIGLQQTTDLTGLAESNGVTLQLGDNEITVLGRKEAVRHLCDTGFLDALFANDLPQPQGFARQSTQGSMTSSNGQGSWSRQQTAEGQVSCVSTTASYPSSDSLQALFGEQRLGPRLSKKVPCTTLSAPTSSSSAARAGGGGQICSCCGNAVSTEANFCFACGQIVRATPSIAAAMEAASVAQALALALEPPRQATGDGVTVMARLSV